MTETEQKAIAVVGIGAVMPDAPDAAAFWRNLRAGRYSIGEVPRERWDPALYYDPDPRAPNKTYSKIGAWVRDFTFNPVQMGIPIPPRVVAAMDPAQQWAISASYQALRDYGYPERPLNPERVAVVLGNSLAGEYHYFTSLRVRIPFYQQALAAVPEFDSLPEAVKAAILDGLRAQVEGKIPEITEDTMPGELSNIIAGRVANVFNFSGPNFVTDAACASSFAALQAAVHGLRSGQFDAVLTGGVDRNMGVEGFVKFCKIGALSPDGSRPYAEGANGFVMGEGAGIFLLKRLLDAEEQGDRIYAVIRGVGGSSDGKGKGITAPNPVGQQRAIERAWLDAGLSPAEATYIEGHGTSTRVGDVAEVDSMQRVMAPFNLPPGRILLGSVKSNIGHLKSAAGAAGMLKAIDSLHHGEIPPTVNFNQPNPLIGFGRIPFFVTREAHAWERPRGGWRRVGVSSFGFGGTNFHVVMEEHVPGLLTGKGRTFPAARVEPQVPQPEPQALEAPRGLFFAAGRQVEEVVQQVRTGLEAARQGVLPPVRLPAAEALRLKERLAMDYEDARDLAAKLEKALKAYEDDRPQAWRMLSAQGIFRGQGEPGKVVFMFPGQGSQYANMLRELAERYPVVAETYREADAVMEPLLGRKLTDYIFVEGGEESIKQAELALRDTTITQPAVLTADVAVMRLMQAFGFGCDYVVGHSLGEYAALVAAGVLTFGEALQVVSARGKEMSKVSLDDNGCMAAVSAPIEKVQKVLDTIDGYVVIANVNSPSQSVIAGNTAPVEEAIERCRQAGWEAARIPVSHAFHTRVVAPANVPLRQVIARMDVRPPRLPVLSNVTSEPYPSHREAIMDLMAEQLASPVQFVKTMDRLYTEGVRVYVEVGPKRVLSALASDNLKGREDVSILYTNHPRKGALPALNEALCALLAAGVVPGERRVGEPLVQAEKVHMAADAVLRPAPVHTPALTQAPAVAQASASTHVLAAAHDGRLPLTGSVVISGAGLGLPGKQGSVFSDDNIDRILSGEIFIEELPEEERRKMLGKRVTRLEKRASGAEMVVIEDLDRTIKLAGQRGRFDLAADFGVQPDRLEALDISTQLAIAAGIEALRDAGIPLVMRYKQTSTGSLLPDRWMLPEPLADETGVVFGSAFPGLDRMADETGRFYRYQALKDQADLLRSVRAGVPAGQRDLLGDLDRRIEDLERQLADLDYHFDRRFIFRILNMGHSQFAEYIGARGPNTAVNAACATTTHAVAIAEDWIRSGRCRRVLVIAGDDVTGGPLTEWVGTGLLATGATTTEGEIERAVLPFDRRRNGMIMGMGAAALVVESQDAVQERGMQAICEVLSTQIANSAFHGTRLHVEHVSQVMNNLLLLAEERFGIERSEIAGKTMFVSHETYTPARGGSAAAEIRALRDNFGEHSHEVVIANTKGFTGHTMGVGVEDVVAAKALQMGRIPPIANIDNGFEPDPELGDLRLSRGGPYPVEYALRLGAGFGSQIAMLLLRKIPGMLERTQSDAYGRWLAGVAGYGSAEVEIVSRTLRIRDQGPPSAAPAGSRWRIGQGPTQWAPAPETVLEPAPRTEPALAPPLTIGDRAAVQAYVVGLISEKTGYPPEMLDPELDLEADLGVDTVKQAELFVHIREQYGIPRRDDLRLSDYTTLSRVVDFVLDALPGGPAPSRDAPAAVASEQAGLGREAITAWLLSLVSEKTGYPVEMLALDLDLEADLGIDTVKQAELFVAIREHYGIPRREDLRLSDYNTLAKVVVFVEEALSAPVELPSPQVAPPAPAGEERTAIIASLLAMVSEKTGYPVEMLDLALDLEADLGIDTVKQAELFVQLREQYGIPRREDLRLSDYNTLSKVAGYVESSLAERSPVGVPVAAATVLEPGPESATPPDITIATAGGEPALAVVDFLLPLVAEKTGYPVEMLEMDLDLEADLGIDTVKQAEMMALIREKFQIARREDMRLSDYNTLAKVVAFVQDALAEQAASVAADQTPEEGSTVGDAAVIPETPEIPRRVPVVVLRPRLELCKPTGLEVGPEKRFIIVKEAGGGVADSLARRLRARKAEVLVLDPAGPSGLVGALPAGVLVHGVFFLPGLEPEAPVAETNFATWQAALQRRVHDLFALMRALEGDIPLFCATRMGGLFGYGQAGPAAPLGAAVAGFTKAYSWEHRGTPVKVVDFELGAPDRSVAEALLEEALHDPGAVEIGREGDQRFTISLASAPISDPATFPLTQGSVFLVTGGAGGICTPIAADLAQACRGVFYLTGRTPAPQPGNPDLDRLAQDPQGLRQDLMKRFAAAGQKATPAMIEREMAALERAAGVLQAVEAIRQAGGKAHYVVCDVTDGPAVEDLVRRILSAEGRLDVVIHAAGVEKSHLLAQKPPEEFESVFNVKVHGFFHLFKALQHALPPDGRFPAAFVTFTSVAGRLGNAGQTDYSAANDLLCKLGMALQPAFSHTRFLAIDWGAWGEVGMASRGSLPRLMERAGIEMMPPGLAAPLVRHELQAGSRGEVLLAGSLGMLARGRDRDGGLDLPRVNQALTAGKPVHVMLSRVTGLDLYSGIRLEVDLDPRQEPFLHDHALNGIPVLPGVMGIEGFSIAASHIASVIGSNQTGYHITGLEDIRFHAAFKFYRDEPRLVTWLAQVYRNEGGLEAHVTLESSQRMPPGVQEKVLHFSGKVHMRPKGTEQAVVTVTPPVWQAGLEINSDQIYRLFFHGPSFQVLEGVQRSGDLLVGRLRKDLAPITNQAQDMLTAPLLVELCLQTAGVWDVGRRGRLSLPSSIGRLRLYQTETNGGRLYAEVSPCDCTPEGCFDARVIDDRGHVYLELSRYCTVDLPYDVEETLAAPMRRLAA